jgi:hypothetical protein
MVCGAGAALAVYLSPSYSFSFSCFPRTWLLPVMIVWLAYSYDTCYVILWSRKLCGEIRGITKRGLFTLAVG